MDSYLTVRKEASDEYIIKKSRFIASVKPVTTQEEAAAFIAGVSKKYWNATHNVFAYALRDSGFKKFSDDGEPQGTAGKPVLDVLEKTGVTDCAIVVTRYFGGIMLGAGGLVRAYSHSASVGLEAAGIVTRALCVRAEVNCDYNFYGRLSALIPAEGGITDGTDFGENVTVTLRLPEENFPAFNAKLIDASNGRFSAKCLSSFYADID